MRGLALVGLLALVSLSSRADEIYTYTGPAPADLSGSFITPAPLVSDGSSNLLNALFSSALSWNFTDGVDTWTPANSTFSGGAHVNPDGSFLIWAFTLLSLDSSQWAFSYTDHGATYYQDSSPRGDSWEANQSSWEKPKGSWTMADPPSAIVSAPEPKSIVLASIGLFCLLIIALMDKRKGGDAT